jgi:hypothetical protein
MVGSSAVYPIIALLVRVAPINRRRSQIDPATLPKEDKRDRQRRTQRERWSVLTG